ncbi:MAG: DUF1467 family protein [Alphaproteobacteria bacterium]
MGVVTGIIVFLLVWWVMLFTVLPFGHRRDEDGTPVTPNMKRKLIITTGVSVVIWGAIFALVQSDLISFHDMAKTMMEEDL